ncbi:MAG TPA: CDC27 family protein [Flavobacteriaceae bacterium]|nr:CDC27 family protein [Flavobacteriaceae bacterium]
MDKETLINKYFEQHLTAEEKTTFFHLMETDAEFASEVKFQEDLKKAITLESRDALKKQLRQIEENRRPSSKRQWIYIAATIALVIGLATLFFTSQPSNEQLFASYYEPFPNVVEPIVRNSGNSSMKTDAFFAYENQKYEEAAALFDRLIAETGEDYAFFYGAVSHLSNNEASNAINLLSSHEFHSDFKDKAPWFLALAYLRANKNDEAKLILQDIIESKKFNSHQAQTLLDVLQKQ